MSTVKFDPAQFDAAAAKLRTANAALRGPRAGLTGALATGAPPDIAAQVISGVVAARTAIDRAGARVTVVALQLRMRAALIRLADGVGSAADLKALRPSLLDDLKGSAVSPGPYLAGLEAGLSTWRKELLKKFDVVRRKGPVRTWIPSYVRSDGTRVQGHWRDVRKWHDVRVPVYTESDKVIKNLRNGGRVVKPIGIALDVRDVVVAKDGRERSRAAGSAAGGMAGAAGGAQLGATIGAAGGPVGIAVGAAGGAVVGGIVGSGVGKQIGGAVHDGAKKAAGAAKSGANAAKDAVKDAAGSVKKAWKGLF